MVTVTKPIITQEELERWLPNRLRRSGSEYRTGTDGSRSGTNLVINLEKQVYYDFHYNQGGSLISLLRQLAALVIGAYYPQIRGRTAVGLLPDPFANEHLTLIIAYLHYIIKPNPAQEWMIRG